MSLELVNALASLVTVIIVAATAIAALVQLRHLRAGNQINAMLSIGEELGSKTFTDAGFLVRQKLEAAQDDPHFRDYAIAYARGQSTSDGGPGFEQLLSSMNLVGNAFEELGILVKNGIVDKGLFLDRYSWVILRNWKRSEKLLALAREASGLVAPWENFEYLAVLSEDWLKHNPSSYPNGIRRMVLHNPWPLTAAASS
jgi:hypothetical protein